jgi:hypothetical protein
MVLDGFDLKPPIPIGASAARMEDDDEQDRVDS